MARIRRRRLSPPQILFDEAPCPRPDLEGPCHIFRGGKHRGYGRVWNGRNMLVHVYVWQLKNGPVPVGMVIDHQCRVRACCNVNHLRLVTRSVNVKENVKGHPWQLGRAKTHCPRGHRYSPGNTMFDARGCRGCRECSRIRTLAAYRATARKKKQSQQAEAG